MAKKNEDQTHADQTQSPAAGAATPNPSPPAAPVAAPQAPAPVAAPQVPAPVAAPQVPAPAPTGLRSDDWAAHVKGDPSGRPQARYKLFTPNPGFEGQRVSVSFRDGVGWTDNGLRRTALAELGYAWLDTETGERWWPGKPAERDPKSDDGTKTA